MSAFGTKGTSQSVRLMSAFGGKADQPGVSVASCTVSYFARRLASASGSGFPPCAIKSRNSSKYFSCPGGAVISSIRPGDDPEFPNACAAPGGTNTQVPG